MAMAMTATPSALNFIWRLTCERASHTFLKAATRGCDRLQATAGGLMEDLRICGGSVLAALLAVFAASAYGAARTPDVSGIYWATQYHARIQIVGGGDLPLTAAS